MCASPAQAGRMKIAHRFNGGKEICEKKQDFEARRSTEKPKVNSSPQRKLIWPGR
jgi:hypothetical protein